MFFCRYVCQAVYVPVVAGVDNISHADRVRFVRFYYKCSRSYHTDSTLICVCGKQGQINQIYKNKK